MRDRINSKIVYLGKDDIASLTDSGFHTIVSPAGTVFRWGEPTDLFHAIEHDDKFELLLINEEGQPFPIAIRYKEASTDSFFSRFFPFLKWGK